MLAAILVVAAAVAVAVAVAVVASNAVDGTPDTPSEDSGNNNGGLVGAIVGAIVAVLVVGIGILTPPGLLAAVVIVIAGAAAGYGHDIISLGVRSAWGFVTAGQTQTSDNWRPAFHFSAASGWINDPCGLIRIGDTYHLYCQHIAVEQTADYYSFIFGANLVEWGHACNGDLIFTEAALTTGLQSEEGLGVPFTGSGVIFGGDGTHLEAGNDKRMARINGEGAVFLFTHNSVDFFILLNQKQSLAYASESDDASDGGSISMVDLTLHSGNPVLSEENLKGAFRDPNVFKTRHNNQQSSWHMVVAAKRSVRQYRSPTSSTADQRELLDWQFQGALEVYRGKDFVECPCVVTVPVEGTASSNERRRVLLYSKGAYPGGRLSGNHFRVFSETGNAFQANAAALVFDHGPDFYAAQGWSGLPGSGRRPVITAWMNNWQYAEYLPTNPWRGQMTIARELYFTRDEGGDLVLHQQPVTDLATYRGNAIAVDGTIPRSISSSDSAFRLANGKAFDLILEIDRGDASEIAIRFFKGDSEKTILRWTALTGVLSLDRSGSGPAVDHDNFAGVYSALFNPKSAALKFRVLVDRSSIEVFAGDGTVALSALIFSADDSDLIELVPPPAGAYTVNSVEIYPIVVS